MADSERLAAVLAFRLFLVRDAGRCPERGEGPSPTRVAFSAIVACHSRVCRASQIGVTFGVLLNVENNAVCLAIPGKILEIQEQGPLRAARVQFGGIVRQVSLNFVPEAGLGDYVMVHVGFAISRVDASEAERTYKLLEEMGQLEAELPPPAEA
jgi:hydrogenase expression/formation protein HypC